jgi:hypothetical protein
MQKHGGFTRQECFAATSGKDRHIAERVAIWLRKELLKLRRLDRQNAHAARRRLALPLPEICDLALTMIERSSLKPGNNLICLIQELLHVDRHRKRLAELHSEELEKALVLESHMAIEGKKIGVNELARLVGVNPSTVSAWKKSPDYWTLVREAIGRVRLARSDD